MPHPLIEPTDLRARLDDPSVRIFDASFHLAATGRDAEAEYAAAHLPGARRFDIERIADTASPLPHMLPSAADFSAAMSALGLRPSDTVVAYDTVGFFSAARAWWMLRVFGHENVLVLDGGLPAWRAAGYAVESGPGRAFAPSTYRARRDDALVADRAAVEAARAAGMQIVDARGAARFSGTAPDPRPGVRAGHIPGSLNVPLTTLHDAEGRVLPPERLREVFAAAGVDPERPTIATCGSGVTACGIAFGLALLDAPDAAVYDGSWSEWGGDPRAPIESAARA